MKKNKFTRFVMASAVIVCSVLTGCASIVNGTGQNLTIEARKDGALVSGASCKLINDKGTYYVTAPGTVTVHKSYDDLQITCEKTDAAPGTASVKSTTEGMAFGNILVGGIIGAAIDTSSGAAYDYPSLITILMGRHVDLPVPVAPQVANKALGNPSRYQATAILSNATPLTTGAPYKIHQLVGEEMKARFVFAGQVAGTSPNGSLMNYGITPDGNLTVTNVNMVAHTSGTYQLSQANDQICIRIKGGGNWSLLSKCYRLFQIGVNTFVMSSVSDTYFFVYTTLSSTATSPPQALSLHLDPVPPASSFADIADANAVPFMGNEGKARYMVYLAASSPKAFAIGADGSWSMFTNNPTAMRNALTRCMAAKLTSCWLYAVDDKVVWQADPNNRVSLDQTVTPVPVATSSAAPAATP